MNPELENLINIALTDGYLTDKERQVLRRKAEKMGFDLDELDMIIDGRLFELNKTNAPKVDKCPSCGEIINGFSRICPSCEYILNSQKVEDSTTLQESFNSLEQSIGTLKTFKTSASPVINSCLKIVFTGGLYIIYKLFIKKEPLFNRYTQVNQSIIFNTNTQAETLLRKYGTNSEIKAQIEKLLTERDTIIKSRRKDDYIAAFATFAIIGALAYLITLIPTPESAESAKEKTVRLTEEKKIGKAKKAAMEIDGEFVRREYLKDILLLEADSLTKAGKFDEALHAIDEITATGYDFDNWQKDRDKIIKIELYLLLEEKNFTKAYERAGLASTTVRNWLEQQIELSETMLKDSIAEADKTNESVKTKNTKKRKR